jgi:UDP-N-acetylglucosamine--dolichyl-phosphate N-acetylglucosaminephosphotransferase
VLLVLAVSSAVAIYLIPWLIKKMKENGMMGTDINKINKPEIPEMGGFAALVGFSTAVLLLMGIEELIGLENRLNTTTLMTPMLVFFIAAFVGLIDDVAIISTHGKAIFVLMASLPLVVTKAGMPSIDLPFGYVIDFQQTYTSYLFFWIILVPLGISGVANAINMSAGYNGLECGQVMVISTFLSGIAYLRGEVIATLIFAGLMGVSFGIYLFNRYPAKIFIGDIGTLGMGATIGAGVIIGNIEFYGIICILPAFYELGSTAYYTAKGVKRREKCHSPTILEDGRLKPPLGAEKYTLAYYLLNKKAMGEKKLVAILLSLYFICGIIALLLSLI